MTPVQYIYNFIFNRSIINMPKPDIRQYGQCCGNGCQSCVMIDYYRDLSQYNARKNLVDKILYAYTKI